jgi:hypothetical protein
VRVRSLFGAVSRGLDRSTRWRHARTRPIVVDERQRSSGLRLVVGRARSSQRTSLGGRSRTRHVSSDRRSAESMQCACQPIGRLRSVLDEIARGQIGNAIKALAIHSFSVRRCARAFARPRFDVEQLGQQFKLKYTDAQSQLTRTVREFADEKRFCQFNVVTSNMIVIGRTCRSARLVDVLTRQR